LGTPKASLVTPRSSALATVSLLFAVTALLLWPATVAASHGPKKVPPGQARKHQVQVVVVPGPVVTRTVVVVRLQPVPAASPSPRPRPRSVPAGVTQPVAISQPPVGQPVLAGPGVGLGTAPVLVAPRPPVSRPAPGAVRPPPAALTLALPYQAIGVASGAAGTLLLALLLLAARRQRVGAAHQALASELGLRPRQLAALTVATAEGALGRVLSGREEAMLDDLTGVLRRGAGMAALEHEIARAERSLLGRLVVAFIDLDGLKEVNDSMGHAAGDQLLRAVAAALASRLRGQDLVLRYGGDEFVAVMPETDVAGARQTLVEIRARLAERTGRKPFSIGLAALRQGDTAQSLVARADAALYESRRLDLS